MKECKIAFAGGSCGMTMIRAGEKLSEACAQTGLRISIQYLDLWVSDVLLPNVRLVVEMFPYYKSLPIPVVSGRAFLGKKPGEDELMARLVAMIDEIASNC